MLRRKLLPIIALGVIALSRITPNAVHAVQHAPPAPAPVAQGDPMPEMRGSAILDYVLTVDPYVAWGTWPTDAQNPAIYSGYLPADDPHGNAVRVFVNPIALDAVSAPDFSGELPPGSMIVMENYDVTPQSPAALVALTVRVKYPDFQTNDSDWFWVKASPDGSLINAEGAVRDCVACHEQSASDFVMSYTFANAAPGSAGSAGPDLVAQTCTTCHTRAVVDGQSWTRDQWRVFLAGHFVPLDAAALNALLTYLTTLPANGTVSAPAVGAVGSSTGGIIAPHSTEGMTSCSTCHADPRTNSSSVSTGSVNTSAPSIANGIVAPHSTEGMTSCSTCHADPRTSSNVSSGSVGSSGGTVIQTCTTCHTPHQASSTTCTSCHTPHPPGGPDDHDDDHDDDHESDDHDDDHDDDDHEDDHDDD